MPDEPSPKRRAEDHVPPTPNLTPESVNVAKSIQRSLRVLQAITVILFLSLAFWVGYSWIQSAKNTKALCALRDAASNNALSAQDFINKHPNGFENITVAELQQRINSYNATVESLSILHCPVNPDPISTVSPVGTQAP